MTIESEKIEKDLRNSIIEYTEKIEIQAQMSEAFHIWKKDTYSITLRMMILTTKHSQDFSTGSFLISRHSINKRE